MDLNGYRPGPDYQIKYKDRVYIHLYNNIKYDILLIYYITFYIIISNR